MRFLLAFLTAFAAATAAAQTPFPDVPPGSWPAAAVERVAERCIVGGLPQGTFGGNEPMTRYEMADLASRVLDDVDGRLREARLLEEERQALARRARELADRVTALVPRFEGLQEERRAELEVLERRVRELTLEVAFLRVLAGTGVSGSSLLQWSPLPAPDGALRSLARARERVEQALELASSPAPAPRPLAPPARPWSAAGAVTAATPGAGGIRAHVERDDVVPGLGVRGTADVRFGEARLQGAVAAHLIARGEPRRFGAACWAGYVGAGAGYRLAPDLVAPQDGLFLSGIVGAETPLRGRFALFGELSVDVHPFAIAGENAPDPVRPGLSVGVRYRF